MRTSSQRSASAALLALLPAAAIVSAQSVGAPPDLQDYAPRNVTCPSRSLIRSAGLNVNGASNQSVNSNEALYIQNRRQNVVGPAFEAFLANNLTGYDLNALAPNASYWPNVGIAVSGGGYRAALVGAGTFQALDGRNASSVERGSGGVWQLASYMTGLSGGSWFVSSFAVNDMPSIQDLVLGGSGQQGWFLEYNLVLPGDGILGIVDTNNFYDNIEARVDGKQALGFNTSITDAWSVALAYHFGGPDGTTADNFFDEGAGLHNTNQQWGEIRETAAFQNYSMPFPAITANSRPPNFNPVSLGLYDVYIPLNATTFEFNPYEMGSYDPALAHFIELDYVGTNLYQGQPFNSTGCVNGFSSFAFLVGTSSSLFNAIVQTANTTLLGLGDGEGIIENALDGLLGNIGADLRSSEDDLAIYPNPFQGLRPRTFDRTNDNGLQLVDGGENGCNIPLDPLLVKARGVDTIIAVDGSGDTEYSWPNATALRSSYARAMALPDGYQTLPYFPSAETFVNDGLNVRPTFFGCNASSAEVDSGMPMVIYLPNAPVGNGGYQTNTTTFQLEYSREETQNFMNSIWETMSRGYPEQGQATDPNYKACLACGIVERRRQAANLTRTQTCEQCFDRYCYNAGPADGGAMSAALHSAPDTVYENDALLHP